MPKGDGTKPMKVSRLRSASRPAARTGGGRRGQEAWSDWRSQFSTERDARGLLSILQTVNRLATEAVTARWKGRGAELRGLEDHPERLSEADLDAAKQIMAAEEVVDAVLHGRAGDAAYRAIELLSLMAKPVTSMDLNEAIRAWSAGTKVRASAAKGGRMRKGVNKKIHLEILRRAEALSGAHKQRGHRYSQRAIARTIARTLGISENTVRDLIRKKLDEPRGNQPD